MASRHGISLVCRWAGALLIAGLLLAAPGLSGGQAARADASGFGEADGESSLPLVSPDGRSIVFVSDATNLVDDDTNGTSDIFVKDLVSGGIQRVSLDENGLQANEMSTHAAFAGSGNTILFVTLARLLAADTDDRFDLYARDLSAGTTRRIVTPVWGGALDGDIHDARVSADGRFAVFHSSATNLVEEDRNDKDDVFRLDLATGRVERASMTDDGGEGNGHSLNAAVSPDGSRVAFETDATNLVPGDANARSDVFIRDMDAATTTRVSVSTGGAEGDGASGNGRFVSNDVVVFDSGATDLVGSDDNEAWDIFVHTLSTGVTRRVSVRPGGGDADGSSVQPAPSPDGRWIAFASQSTNLDPRDTDGLDDLFVVSVAGGPARRVSRPILGRRNDGVSGLADFAPGSDRLVFASESSALVAGDTNGVVDIFVADLTSGKVERVSTGRR